MESRYRQHPKRTRNIEKEIISNGVDVIDDSFVGKKEKTSTLCVGKFQRLDFVLRVEKNINFSKRCSDNKTQFSIAYSVRILTVIYIKIIDIEHRYRMRKLKKGVDINFFVRFECQNHIEISAWYFCYLHNMEVIEEHINYTKVKFHVKISMHCSKKLM